MLPTTQLISEVISKIFPNKNIRNRFYYLSSILAIISIAIILIFNTIQKINIQKNQISIENKRIQTIDNQLTLLYNKLYNVNENSNTIDTEELLSKIGFLKSQRSEAIAIISKINDNPDTEIKVFFVITSLLISALVFFFSQSFTTERTPQEEIARLVRKRVLNSFTITDPDSVKNIDYSEDTKVHENKLNNINFEYGYKSNFSEEKETANDKIVSYFNEIKSRLSEECDRLNKQALLNLFISFIIAFLILGYIGYIAYFSNNFNYETKTNYELIITIIYLPRLISMIGLLSIFIYFIKLHRENILNVKYYQNELTNTEFKLIAIYTALNVNDSDIISKIISRYSMVDRNASEHAISNKVDNSSNEIFSLLSDLSSNINKIKETIVAK